MSQTKNKYSVAVVKKGNRVIGYLSTRDEEQGKDIILDSKGYTIEAL